MCIKCEICMYMYTINFIQFNVCVTNKSVKLAAVNWIILKLKILIKL